AGRAARSQAKAMDRRRFTSWRSRPTRVRTGTLGRRRSTTCSRAKDGSSSMAPGSRRGRARRSRSGRAAAIEPWASFASSTSSFRRSIPATSTSTTKRAPSSRDPSARHAARSARDLAARSPTDVPRKLAHPSELLRQSLVVLAKRASLHLSEPLGEGLVSQGAGASFELVRDARERREIALADELRQALDARRELLDELLGEADAFRRGKRVRSLGARRDRVKRGLRRRGLRRGGVFRARFFLRA